MSGPLGNDRNRKEKITENNVKSSSRNKPKSKLLEMIKGNKNYKDVKNSGSRKNDGRESLGKSRNNNSHNGGSSGGDNQRHNGTLGGPGGGERRPGGPGGGPGGPGGERRPGGPGGPGGDRRPGGPSGPGGDRRPGSEQKPGGDRKPGGQGKGGKKSSKQESWIPFFVIGVLIIAGIFNFDKIPFVLDKSGEESINQFLVDVENTNQYPMGKERTNNPIYDREQITPDKIHKMGHERYLVYIYTGIETIDSQFNDAILKFEESDNVPVYKLDVSLIVEQYPEWFSKAPMVLDLMRLEQSSIVVGEFGNTEEFEAVWGKVE